MSMTAEQKARLEELLAEGVTLDDVTEVFGRNDGQPPVASADGDDGDNGSGTDPGNGPH